MKLENLFESGVYQMDPNNPSDPEVLVDGVGRYKLSQLKENVRRKLADIGKQAARDDSPEMWEQVRWMINHAAMREMLDAIVNAHEELKKEIH